MGRGYGKDKGDEILKNNNQTANKKRMMMKEP